MSVQDSIRQISESAQKPIIIARAKSLRRLDLACGQVPAAGYEGVDLYAPQAAHKVDLQSYPWPFEDNSVEAIRCSHYIEHIPCDVVRGGPRDGQDALFAFFDECYRIMADGADLHISCPSARSSRAFQDPTHRRFIVAETFLYMNKEWRELNKLDHYRVSCNFGINVNPVILTEVDKSRVDAWKQMAFAHYWNVIMDWDAHLKCLKGAKVS